ncbi:MAG: SRPBCC domain-containing protein [Flavobacteriales bacterium]
MPAAGKNKKKKSEGFIIEHDVLIKAQAKKVFRAIATTEGVQGWWTPDCTVPEEQGAIAEFRFGGKDHMKMNIVKLDQNRLTTWKCTEGDTEWMDTTITFKLVPDGMATKLVFEHAGWKKKTESFKFCTERWGEYMHSIKQYCETGVGKPYGQ